MSATNYNIVANEGRASITVVKNGKMFTADSDSHANISEIIEAAIAGDDDIEELFDIGKAISRKFERLTDRISLSGGRVLLDNDPAPKAISDAIIRHHAAGSDFKPLVNFLDKLANNPSKESVEQLYPWLVANNGFTITEEGDLIAYKGVAKSFDKYVSVNSGSAIVDGERVTGAIPNEIGSIVEMPRSEVVDDSGVPCGPGLHAGTYTYAEGWARGGLLEVLIDPRDVVSVPSDSSSQKLRVCRYRVLNVIDAPHTVPVVGMEYREPEDWIDYFDELDDELDEFSLTSEDELGSVWMSEGGEQYTVNY